MFTTRRYLATAVLALGIIGAVATTAACTGGIRFRPVVVIDSRGVELERRAEAVGYRDGVDEGRSDARHRERYDPVRSRRYRAGDHDYDRRLGPREELRPALSRGVRARVCGRLPELAAVRPVHVGPVTDERQNRRSAVRCRNTSRG